MTCSPRHLVTTDLRSFSAFFSGVKAFFTFLENTCVRNTQGEHATNSSHDAGGFSCSSGSSLKCVPSCNPRSRDSQGCSKTHPAVSPRFFLHLLRLPFLRASSWFACQVTETAMIAAKNPFCMSLGTEAFPLLPWEFSSTTSLSTLYMRALALSGTCSKAHARRHHTGDEQNSDWACGCGVPTWPQIASTELWYMSIIQIQSG